MITGRRFHLEQEGRTPVQDPTLNEVNRALAGIHPRGPSYFILSDESGSYVQAAGAHLRLTVELREATADSFRHFVVGSGPHSEKQTSIACMPGPITVFENEVLDLEKAVVVFSHFFTGSALPSSFVLRDVTDKHRRL